MREETNKIAVNILPWAGLSQDIQIGPVKLWPWDENKVDDSAVRKQLNRYFDCFVDHYGKRVDTITICSHGTPDFHVLNDIKEFNELRAAVDILIFSAICPQTKIAVCSNNESIGPPTADRYQFIGLKLEPPDDKNIVIKAGSLISCDQMDRVHISKPWSVGGSFGNDPDEQLIGAFDKVFSNKFPSDVRERVFRSLEFFKIAHTEADLGLNQPIGTESLSKLVMMATAFEILLEFPESSKSKYFAKQLENRIKTNKFIMEERSISKKNQRLKLSKGGWWAWDFYKLRNRIVHGDNVKPKELRYKGWITYNIVADLVLWEFVKRELYDRGCFEESKKERTAESACISDASTIPIDDPFMTWIFGFEDVHRALGWIK